MFNDAEETTTNKSHSIFQFDEIDIAEVTKFPVKILYEQKNLNFGNILIFNNKADLNKFIKLRKYMFKNIDANSRTPGKIRIFE